jgi:hypothetical protein
MNARLGWEDEATSRAVNAEPWEPMPGMVKRQCPECRYWFAADPTNGERRCPDCARFGSRPALPHPT